MQTTLEQIAIEKRNTARTKNAALYGHSGEDNQYTEDSALVKEGSPWGKGTSKEYTHSIPSVVPGVIPGVSQQLDTSDNVGGLYDKEGRNGSSGRKRLTTINLYNEANPYSADMIDLKLNETDGQVIIKYN